MEIDHNPIERRPMEAFHCGDRAEGLRIQEEFVAMFREEYREKIAVPEGVPLSWQL